MQLPNHLAQWLFGVGVLADTDVEEPRGKGRGLELSAAAADAMLSGNLVARILLQTANTRAGQNGLAANTADGLSNADREALQQVTVFFCRFSLALALSHTHASHELARAP